MSPKPYPSASVVLRRALLLWGSGHISLGDRRGWLLLLFQPLALAGAGLLVITLIDSNRWIITFPALAAVIALWFGQAVHAHRLAIARGSEPGGELQLAWLLALLAAVITGYWFFGGNHATPAATLQHYVSYWHAGRSEAAGQLFTEPASAESVAANWREQREYLRQRVSEAAQRYGSASGLDPTDPFSGLRFVELDGPHPPRTTVVAVDIVRRQRVETSLLGLIPTATQETILVERVGLIELRAVPTDLPLWLPRPDSPPAHWRIEQVTLPVAAP